MSGRVVDPALKARALRLAEEHGPAKAAEMTGVSASKLRVWRTRAKKAVLKPDPVSQAVSSVRSGSVAEPVNGVVRVAADPDGLDAFEARILPEAKKAVELALARLQELIPQAKGVQSIAISSGILMDKIAQLNAVIADAEQRRARIDEAAGEVIGELLRQFVRACGLSHETPAVSRVVRGLLEQAGHGEVLVVSADDAEALRELMVQTVRAEVEDEIRAEAREPLLQLPAPAPEMSADERLREWQLRHRAAPADEDDEDLVVDAEVVCTCRAPRYFDGVCVRCQGRPRRAAS